MNISSSVARSLLLLIFRMRSVPRRRPDWQKSFVVPCYGRMILLLCSFHFLFVLNVFPYSDVWRELARETIRSRVDCDISTRETKRLILSWRHVSFCVIQDCQWMKGYVEICSARFPLFIYLLDLTSNMLKYLFSSPGKLVETYF